MSRNKDTSQAVDTILKMVAAGTLTGASLVAPNAIQMLEKPLESLFSRLEERDKQRKLSKLRSYLKTQGLVRGDYDHGIELTKKAVRRLEEMEFKNMKIKQPSKWDKKWRFVIFDIPESKRSSRVGFTIKIQSLGYQLLQQSVWVHPFDSEDVISKTAVYFGVEEWVSYLETSKIAQNEKLIKRFKHLKLV